MEGLPAYVLLKIRGKTTEFIYKAVSQESASA